MFNHFLWICNAESAENVNISPHFIHALSTVVYHQAEVMGKDLESFAK
jgi:hypothetical protein